MLILKQPLDGLDPVWHQTRWATLIVVCKWLEKSDFIQLFLATYETCSAPSAGTMPQEWSVTSREERGNKFEPLDGGEGVT